MKEFVQEVVSKELEYYVNRGQISKEEAEGFMKAFVPIYAKIAQKELTALKEETDELKRDRLEYRINQDIVSRIENAMLMKRRGGLEGNNEVSRKKIGAGLGVVACFIRDTKELKGIRKDMNRYMEMLVDKGFSNPRVVNILAKRPELMKALLGFEIAEPRLYRYTPSAARRVLEAMGKAPVLFEKALEAIEKTIGREARLIEIFRLAQVIDVMVDKDGLIRKDYLEMAKELKARGLSGDVIRYQLVSRAMEEVKKAEKEQKKMEVEESPVAIKTVVRAKLRV